MTPLGPQIILAADAEQSPGQRGQPAGHLGGGRRARFAAGPERAETSARRVQQHPVESGLGEIGAPAAASVRHPGTAGNPGPCRGLRVRRAVLTSTASSCAPVAAASAPAGAASPPGPAARSSQRSSGRRPAGSVTRWSRPAGYLLVLESAPTVAKAAARLDPTAQVPPTARGRRGGRRTAPTRRDLRWARPARTGGRRGLSSSDASPGRGSPGPPPRASLTAVDPARGVSPGERQGAPPARVPFRCELVVEVRRSCSPTRRAPR